MFKPAYRAATDAELEQIKYTGLYNSFEMLFFSMFGLVELSEILPQTLVPEYRFLHFQTIFCSYSSYVRMQLC